MPCQFMFLAAMRRIAILALRIGIIIVQKKKCSRVNIWWATSGWRFTVNTVRRAAGSLMRAV